MNCDGTGTTTVGVELNGSGDAMLMTDDGDDFLWRKKMKRESQRALGFIPTLHFTLFPPVCHPSSPILDCFPGLWTASNSIPSGQKGPPHSSSEFEECYHKHNNIPSLLSAETISPPRQGLL